MKISILETNKLYAEMLSLPDDKRVDFFDRYFLEPFSDMFERMNMPRDPNLLGYLTLSGADKLTSEMLKQLNDSDAWNEARQAVELALSNLQPTGITIPKEVLLGIFLGNPSMLEQSEGYSGVGSTPGYIQILIAPNTYNIPRLSSCIAHEFHHNVLVNNISWKFMNVSLSQYLAVEGLAESFAAVLYGEEYVGPWVTKISENDLDRTRRIIGQSLDVTGFMEVRNYIYGDHPMVPEGKMLDIPYCGGYAAGYHAIQAYLNSTSKTVGEATKEFLSGEDIVKQSGYFIP